MRSEWNINSVDEAPVRYIVDHFAIACLHSDSEESSGRRINIPVKFNPVTTDPQLGRRGISDLFGTFRHTCVIPETLCNVNRTASPCCTLLQQIDFWNSTYGASR